MRLIDADALMEQLGIAMECIDCERRSSFVGCTMGSEFVIACEAITDAPTIDAVPLEQYRSMERTCYKLQKALYEMADRKDEPQTETEIAKAIVHKMIDDAVIAEDAYPNLRQRLHNAVDAYEPQTESEDK